MDPIYTHPYISLCEDCKGTGLKRSFDEKTKETDVKVCEACNGSGRVVRQSTIVIKIRPFQPGVDDGLTIIM